MTKDGDPLASATLAQLYVAQGHDARARRVLASVLESDPLNGHALALKKRLAAASNATLRIEKRAASLRLHFATKDGSVPDEVRVASWRLVDGRPHASPAATLACADQRGKLDLPIPEGPGSASACLVRRGTGDEPVIIAVAEPQSW